MHANFMGQDVDESGFDWSTGEYAEGEAGGGRTGLTTQGAAVIGDMFDMIGQLGTSVIGMFDQSDGTTQRALIAPAPAPGYVQPRAGMDPVLLMAIGIPVGLLAIAMLGKGRRR